MAVSPDQGDPKDPRRKKVRMAIGGLHTIYPPKRLTQLASRIDAERFARFDSVSEEDEDELRRLVVDEIDRRGRLDDFLEHLFGQPHPYFEPTEDEDEAPAHRRFPVNADFPVEVTESLSRPVVGGPLYECQQVVSLSGFVPKALVQVYADPRLPDDREPSEFLGDVTPHYGFGEVKLNRQLADGDSVYATQTVDGVVGPESDRLVVIRLPEFADGVPVPRLWSPVHECARLVNVDGLIPGARVEVLENGVSVGYADTAGSFKSVGLNRGVELSASGDSPGSLQARQILCPDGAARPSGVSEPPVVVWPAPAPPRIARIVQLTFIPGNDSITVENLTVGADVRILDRGEDIGGGWATAETNWLGLSRRLTSDSELVATMELCDGPVTRSEPSTPELRLPTPRILGPICESDTEVEIAGTVLNATVALLVDGVAMAMVGAAPGESTTVRLGFALDHRTELRAVQFFEPDSSDSERSEPDPIYRCDPPWILELTDEILRDAPAEFRPITCRPSTVPVFADRASVHDVIDVAIHADFDRINSEPLPEDQESAGVVSYSGDAGQQVEISCVVQGRGVSRQGCGWRPLRLVFEDDVTGTIFDGSGRHIDTVTHCGYRPGQWEILAGDDEAEHSRRVMQEFALFQALQSFGGMTLETRLAHFTYFDPSGNNRLERRYGFFRERKNNAAERCGMDRQEDDEGDMRHSPNPTSVFQTAFHHRLLFHYDYQVPGSHNVVRMYDEYENEDFYFPYDFDLSAIAAPDYHRNVWVASNIRDHGNALLSWLRGQDEPLARVQVASVLQREAQLRQVVARSLADDQGKLELEQWSETVLRNLIAFLQT